MGGVVSSVGNWLNGHDGGQAQSNSNEALGNAQQSAATATADNNAQTGNMNSQFANNQANQASAQNTANGLTSQASNNLQSQFSNNQNQANDASNKANTLYGQTQNANQAVNNSTGNSAADMMNKANSAASGQALQAANAAGGASAGAARAAGLNAGQAAQMATQGTAGTYQGQLNTGVNQYQNNTNTLQNQAQNLSGQQSNQANQAANYSNQANQNAATQGNLGVQHSQVAQGYSNLANQNITQGLQQAQNANSIAGTYDNQANQQQQTANQQGSSIMGGITSLFSDENLKTGVSDIGGNGNDSYGYGTSPGLGNLTSKIKGLFNPSAPANTPSTGLSSASVGGDVSAPMGELPSDKNLKSDTKPASMNEILDSLIKNVPPKGFKYKPGVEKNKPNGTQRVGVMAQDLEKTPLKDSVIDTPQGKVIDVPQATGNNLALIIELAGQLRDLQKQVSTMQGAK